MQLVDFNELGNQLNRPGVQAVPIAVDATGVYFGCAGTLLKVPLQGGPVSTLLQTSTTVNEYNDVALTSTAVLFHYPASTTGDDEAIVSVPKAGGPPTMLATSNGMVGFFAADDSSVYFTDQGGIEAVPLTGGSVRLITAAIAHPSGLAVVGANLVVTSNYAGSDGTVYSVPTSGGTLTTLASAQTGAEQPLACGSDICWWTGTTGLGPTPGFTTGSIARLTGDRVTTILAPTNPETLSFDGTDFYQTQGADISSGGLFRVPASGGPAVPMVPAWYATLQGGCVYFSVALGFGLPSSYDGGVPGSGVYVVGKSYMSPQPQRDM